MAPRLTPAQLAERWSVSLRTVNRMCESGRLRALKVGRFWRVSLEAVEAYEARHTSQPPAPEPETVGSAPRTTQAGHRAAVELDGDYVPVFKGPVPWRSSVIEDTQPRRGSRAAT